MHFKRELNDVEISLVRDFGEKGARFRIDFFGGSQEFFGKVDKIPVGRHAKATVECRITGRDSYWIGVTVG